MAPTLNTIYFYNKICNLRCRHCWIEPASGDTPAAAALTFPEVQDLFLQGKSLGMTGAKLTGGEPLLLPYILPLLRFLRHEKLSLVVETNGTLIDDEMAAALKEARAFVSVSLDGTTEAIHNLLRAAPGSFEAALQGIRRLTKAGLSPQIIFSLHRKNAHNLPAMIDSARSLGARSLKINLIRGIGRAKEIEADDELVSAEEFIHLYREYKDRGGEGFEVLFDIPAAFKRISEISQGGCGTCGIMGIIGVLSDGTVSLCGIGNIVDDLCFGNIRQHPLAQIWENTPTLRFIREEIPAALEGICGRCILKGMCLGKCMANTYYSTGCLTKGHLFCEEAYRAGLFPAGRLL
jgi:SynChlorMet cassette radical SAM/SPASM protein ScmF